ALAPLVWRFGRAEGGPALNALLVDTARAGTRTGLLAAAGIVFVSFL
ncbi:MAG: 1,4-dihydroxy-2-naphthoate octaprenyltransferase, partial [Rhodocyclaceae bacterium]